MPGRRASDHPERTYQGDPCPHGHDGMRYRSNRACVTCTKERNDATPRRYVRKADRAPGFRTVRKGEERPPKAKGVDTADTPSSSLGLRDAEPQVLGDSLAHAMKAAGRMHVALTYLEGSGLWQAVTLRPGYKDQVTRTGCTAGEALARAMGEAPGRSDALLRIVD